MTYGAFRMPGQPASGTAPGALPAARVLPAAGNGAGSSARITGHRRPREERTSDDGGPASVEAHGQATPRAMRYAQGTGSGAGTFTPVAAAHQAGPSHQQTTPNGLLLAAMPFGSPPSTGAACGRSAGCPVFVACSDAPPKTVRGVLSCFVHRV